VVVAPDQEGVAGLLMTVVMVAVLLDLVVVDVVVLLWQEVHLLPQVE